MTVTMAEFLTAVFWTSWLSSFTIEFAVLFSKMSHGVLGVLRTDLALDKVGCHWLLSVGCGDDGNCDDILINVGDALSQLGKQTLKLNNSDIPFKPQCNIC